MIQKNKNKTAIVTGGTGYIGGYLINKLIIEKWNVYAIVRENSKFSHLKKKQNISIFVYNGKINSIISFFKKIKPDIIFHLSSLFISSHTPKDLVPLISSNLLFGTQVLEAAKIAKIKYFINTGSYWQHYNNDEFNPVNLYASTKQAFEDIIKYYSELHGLKFITLILCDVYGPKDKRNKIINLLKKTNKEKLLLSPGYQLIDPVYIDDVINAYIIASKMIMNNKKILSQRYLVSSQRPITLRNLVNEIEFITKKKLNIKFSKRPYNLRENFIICDKEILPNWSTRVTLNDGLKKIFV